VSPSELVAATKGAYTTLYKFKNQVNHHHTERELAFVYQVMQGHTNWLRPHCLRIQRFGLGGHHQVSAMMSGVLNELPRHSHVQPRQNLRHSVIKFDGVLSRYQRAKGA
jgi:hypothetical protein